MTTKQEHTPEALQRLSFVEIPAAPIPADIQRAVNKKLHDIEYWQLVEAERDRRKAENAELREALESIANSVALVLTAKAVPFPMREGMKAIEDEARAALAKGRQ